MKKTEIVKFVQVLKDAKLAASAAVADMEDGGTCNFDAPAIRDLRMTPALTGALGEAGFNFYLAKRHGIVLGIGVGFQAMTRTKGAEVFTRYLQEHGYDAHTYYQAD